MTRSMVFFYNNDTAPQFEALRLLPLSSRSNHFVAWGEGRGEGDKTNKTILIKATVQQRSPENEAGQSVPARSRFFLIVSLRAKAKPQLRGRLIRPLS